MMVRKDVVTRMVWGWKMLRRCRRWGGVGVGPLCVVLVVDGLWLYLLYIVDCLGRDGLGPLRGCVVDGRVWLVEIVGCVPWYLLCGLCVSWLVWGGFAWG